MTEARPYKVIELSTVTDESIEEALNLWTIEGYELRGIHFAMRESSRRPAMAFLVFGPPHGVPSDLPDDRPRAKTSTSRDPK